MKPRLFVFSHEGLKYKKLDSLESPPIVHVSMSYLFNDKGAVLIIVFFFICSAENCLHRIPNDFLNNFCFGPFGRLNFTSVAEQCERWSGPGCDTSVEQVRVYNPMSCNIHVIKFVKLTKFSQSLSQLEYFDVIL